MAYKLSTAFDIAQKERARFVLEESARTRSTPTDTITRLTKEGLTYRRTNMLEDYARAQTVSLSKSMEALERAENFFANTLAPYQAETGLPWSELGEIMTAYKGEYEVPEELQTEVDNWAEWVEEQGT